jgi:hypothetical protein
MKTKLEEYLKKPVAKSKTVYFERWANLVNVVKKEIIDQPEDLQNKFENY